MTLQQMKSFAASDLKTKIGEMFVAAAKEPVQITKRGAVRFVLMTDDEYRRLEAIEDALWAARAYKALESGFVGPDNAERLLREALAAKVA
ncbi:MAG: type II toxin-antitoxin system Phd/YefM family antitoxin [Methylocella sp.]